MDLDLNPLVMKRNYASYHKHLLQGEQDKLEVMLKEYTNAKLKQYQQRVKEKFAKMYETPGKSNFTGFKSP